MDDISRDSTAQISGMKGAPKTPKPSEKRRAQNRLAQQNYRKRMREIGLRTNIVLSPTESSNKIVDVTMSSSSSAPPTILKSSSIDEITRCSMPSNGDVSCLRSRSSGSSRSTSDGDDDDESILQSTSIPWTQYAVNKSQLYKLGPMKFNQMMANIEKLIQHDYRRVFLSSSPRSDMLLNLVQFNVFRALVQNSASMGFTMEWLKESAMSPWGTEEANGIDLRGCPPSLQPTTLQRMVVHHPWIDLFPFPQIRDNLLLADSYYDEDRLCNDVVEFCDIPNESTGLVVWGDPCNPTSWEVSETFIRNWAWVIRGCHEVQAATNYWRRKRGECELRFEHA